MISFKVKKPFIESTGRSGSRGGSGSSLDPESELTESLHELKSDSGARSRAGIVTPQVFFSRISSFEVIDLQSR